MGIFYKDNRSLSGEEQEALISLLPGYQSTSRMFTSAKAIENSDVFTAVHMISSDIATLQLEKRIRGTREMNDYIANLFNVKPNSIYNGYQFKFILMANALLNGEAFAEIIRDRKGNPTELVFRPNNSIIIKMDQDTSYRLEYHMATSDGKNVIIKPENMLHIKFFTLDGIRGNSPLTSLRHDLNTQEDSKKFLSRFFKNGTHNGGILRYKGGKLSKEAREKLRKEWDKSYSGVDSSHGTIVMDETMEYDPIKVDTEVLKLINTSNHSTAQVGKVFGIPRHKFGLETANMNISEMNMDYLVNTLSPYLESIVSEIEYKLLDDNLAGGVKYKFNTDDYKMIDPETKAKISKMKLETGMNSLNELREDYGDEPIGEIGDKHFISLNLASLDMIDEYQMSKATNMPLKGGDTNDDGKTDNGDDGGSD